MGKASDGLASSASGEFSTRLMEHRKVRLSMTPPRLLLSVLLLSMPLLALAAPSADADPQTDAIKTFKKSSKIKDWRERRLAFRAMAACDSTKGVDALLAATVKERNAVVALAGIKVLGAYKSEEAQASLASRVAKASGTKSTIVLMALARQKGGAGTGILSEVLRGDDGQRAALAALALGAKAQEYSLEDLLAALNHTDWHVVAAAARGLEQMALSARPQTSPPAKSGSSALPKWFPKNEVLHALIARLKVATGAERGDLIQALETITTKRYGWNVSAWAMLAAGKKPDANVLLQRKYPPQMFGIPLYGRRIAIVVDATVHIDNAHPFKVRKRLQDVCQVAGARELPWFRINTIDEFNRAHVARGIRDMPDEDQKFEVFFSAIKTEHVFGKMVPANPGNKEKAIAHFDKIKFSNGNDVFGSMTKALDVSGRKDAVAWQKGPDTVICVCSSNPSSAKETDQEVIGTAIGMKAGSRLVRIEAIGVYQHAFVMLKLFAELSGGRYVSLEK
jgi:hypothetical protein